MATVSSLAFVSETKTESFAILLRNNGFSRSSRFPFFATLPRKTPESNLFKSLRLVSKAPRAIGEESSEESESQEESEDSIQATIEKSKKVLAMQRELLQQIAERKKLIASIKDSTVESGEEDNPYELEQASSLETSLTDEENLTEEEENGSALSLTPQAEPVKQWKDAIFSKPSAEQPKVKNVTKLPVSETETKPRKDILPKKKVPPQVGLVKEAKNSGFDTLPSFLSSASEITSPKNYERVKAKEPSLKLAGNGKVDAEKEVAKPPPLAGANVMNILIVAAECAPWSKTGGLGDVAGALPKALAQRGHRVMVVVPLYGNYSEPKDTGVRRKYKVCNQEFEVAYSHAFIDGVDFVFIDNHMFRNVQSNIYGGNRSDILRRMVLFCKAAVEVPWHVPCGGVCYGDGNLAFIANDWHTALLPVYLKAYYRDNGLMTFARSTLVIHNIAHQGRGPVDDFSMVDLPHHYLDLFKLYDPVGGEHFNIFAAGLKTADRIVTVSHGYAWELKTIEGGWGLHGIINDNDWKLRGIVNGIDTDEWSPELDAHLTTDGYSNYSLETLSSGKPKCKAALQKELGLPVRSDVPLIGFIGRLDQQKGVDLIAEAIPWIVDQDAQLVMLGTGRQDLENMLREAENRNRDKVRGWVGFSVKTAHRITAGADVLLMPSRFEPCGLNQLYAMKYGTVPVVHAVGGLRDTVHPFDPYNESGLGWTFDGAETGKLIHALGNCLFTFRDYKKSWEGLMRRGMSLDLSWDRAAVSYEEVLVAAKYQW